MYRLFVFLIAGLPLSALTVDEVLAKMDQSASTFKTMQADFTREEFTKVINLKEDSVGKIALLRSKYKDVHFRIDFTQPDERSVDYADRVIQVYTPKTNTVQVYDLKKQGRVLDDYLTVLLGFGTPGSELKRGYSVEMLGQGDHDGKPAVHLKLTPLSRDAQKQMQYLDLWVDAAQAYPMEQKVVLPSGDYKLFRYRNTVINPALKSDQLKLKLPKSVHVETPQKG